MDMSVFRDRCISDNHWSGCCMGSRENLEVADVIAVVLEISDFPVVQPIGYLL